MYKDLLRGGCDMNSKRIALCGVLCALGVVLMMLGGLFPLATFCSPALAALVLIPIMIETDRRMALGAYVAIAALSLLLAPDKESALLFAFLGYYPILKPKIDQLRARWLRIAVKLALFDIAAGAMLLVATYLFGMAQILAEYAEMGRALLIAFIVIANLTMLIYDRLTAIADVLYVRRLRPKFFGRGKQ